MNIAMSKKFTMINTSFDCENCGETVSIHPEWSARNHCPRCLHSKHLDLDFPWDRLSECYWMMKPVWIDYKKNKWNMIKHRCILCKKEILNKVAPDDDFITFISNIHTY